MTNAKETNRVAPIYAVLRFCLSIAFTLHFAIAATWLWISPKGFPIATCRFWLNGWLPIVVLATACFGLWNLHRRHIDGVSISALLFGAGWLGLAISGRACFPISLAGFWELAVIVAVLGFGCAWLAERKFPRFHWSLCILTSASMLLGVFIVWAQLPSPASTRPWEEQPPAALGKTHTGQLKYFSFGDRFRYDTKDRRLSFRAAHITFDCHPLLGFTRPSPDGFWSLLAPRQPDRDHLLKLVSKEVSGPQFRYNDSTVVQLSNENEKMLWSSWSTVEEETYTHLNSFCLLWVRGQQDPKLRFSPCPDTTIDVLPADYPTGRPARFAYLTDQNEFCVVEASSGEKGPFHPLATGKLQRGEPLTISFVNGDLLVAIWTLNDWAKQLSTELSPTAGWGVPQNAIEFRRSGNDKNSPIEIHVTLAATSVGRGYETVGHRAGVYRNVMSFQIESEAAKQHPDGQSLQVDNSE